MDVLFRTWRAIPWQRSAQILASRSTELFFAGGLLGVLAVSGLTQFQALWGSSGPIERGLAVTVMLGLMASLGLQRRMQAPWPVWLMLTATVSLVLPWWQELLTDLVFRSPTDLVHAGFPMESLGLTIGLASLFFPMLCWASFLNSVCETGDLSRDSDANFPPIGLFAAGCAAGLFLTAIVWGPWCGIEIASIGGAAAGLAVSYRAWLRGSRRKDSSARNPIPATGSRIPWGLCGLGLCGCGGALALSQNLAGQLMPQSVYIQHIAWAIAACGMMIGGRVAEKWPHPADRSAWAVLLIIAGLSFNGLALKAGIHFSLWSAAFLINATVHQMALAGILLAALLPISIAAGLLIGRPRAGSLTKGIAAVIFGATCFRELAVWESWSTLAVGLLVGLACLSAVLFFTTRSWPAVHWQRAAAVTGLVIGGLSPVLQPAVDPGLPAQLLFSTPTFLAYRAGWSTDLLPQLDDSRLLATSAGRHGALTVWKSGASNLILREAGVPRCAISCRPDHSPQLASEVLQAVFPMLVAQEARQVLLLGSSGGMPLSTCLSFPVQHVRCVEPDIQRIELIRGPIAAERGFDPFSDDRVEIDQQPVEVAAMQSDGSYDVILSSPPMSAEVAAASQFTREFYRHVSRKLSENGLFCQRFEAIDYGPGPFQLVTRSLLSAFREVVAVEIGVGEYLFLATNSDRGLAPAEFPARLETDHVRRVLARCGWDWSTVLTLSAWDRTALQEIAADGADTANTFANCRLAFTGPRDMLRWSPKRQEVQNLLTKPRSSRAPDFAATEADGGQAAPSRRSRYLDWLDNGAASQDLLRRLSEVAAQTKIILDGPDSFWLDYRKALRDELQQRPRTEIRQVAASEATERVLHAEDERRKNYFVALSAAGNLESRSLDAVFRLAEYFEPYDPLVSLFARQETAELLALYGHPDPVAELSLRLHVIHFAPHGDRSLRNVLSAAELVLRSPEAAPDPQDRFDTLNSLLQTFRRRWEVRSNSHVKSVRLAIQDVDRSIVVIEKMVAAMDELVSSTQIAPDDWQARREVIDRVLLRPLRGYRADLMPQFQYNKLKTEAVLRDAQAKKSLTQ